MSLDVLLYAQTRSVEVLWGTSFPLTSSSFNLGSLSLLLQVRLLVEPVEVLHKSCTYTFCGWVGILEMDKIR